MLRLWQSATCKVDNKNKLLPLGKDNDGDEDDDDNYNYNLTMAKTGSSVITQAIGLLSDIFQYIPMCAHSLLALATPDRVQLQHLCNYV